MELYSELYDVQNKYIPLYSEIIKGVFKEFYEELVKLMSNGKKSKEKNGRKRKLMKKKKQKKEQKKKLKKKKQNCQVVLKTNVNTENTKFVIKLIIKTKSQFINGNFGSFCNWISVEIVKLMN